jgi:alkylation response protein AidB-like acyl-CoA dehydrogenase
VLAVYTEEQNMLGDAVKKFARDYGLNSPADLKTVDRVTGWKALSEMGLAGLRMRDSSGKPMASAVEIAVAVSALAERLVPLPLLGSALFPVELLALAQTPAERLSALSEGRQPVCILFDVELAKVAEASEKTAYSWDCQGAEFGLSITPSGSDFSVAVHPITSTSDHKGADLTRAIVKVEIGSPIERYTLSADDRERWLGFALTLLAADILGAMRGALNGAVEYSKVRVQYKVPIGSFQAVQHLCSEALVKITGTLATVNYAAWSIDEMSPAEALLAAQTAKAYAASVGRPVCETVMQVYGGLGQTWESIAHLYLRRVMVSTYLLGGLQATLADIADARLGAK